MKKRLPIFFGIIILFCIDTNIHAQQVININGPDVKRPDIRATIEKSLFNDAERYREFTYNPKLRNLASESKGDTLLLDFFEDKKYRAVIKNTTSLGNGRLAITAQIVGVNFGYCYISVSNNGISMTVELPDDNEQYFIAGVNGKTYLSQYKMSKVYEDVLDCGGTIEYENVPANVKTSQHIHTSVIANDNILTATLDDCEEHNIENGATIDVMVVYTKAASKWALNYSRVTDIDDLIDIAIQKSNEAMDNSLTGITFRLVHKYETDYVEVDSNEDLNRIRTKGDGYMDEVHDLRKQFNADLVVFLPEVSFTGGLAGLLYTENGNAQWCGFSLSRVQQTSTSYTMVHEMGHNMGCHHHNKQTSQAGPGLYSYSGGWRGVDNLGNKYSTIMTYESGSYFTDGQSHPRIPYFSSPDIMVNGVVIGDRAEANNVLTLKKTKHVTSKYSGVFIDTGWNYSKEYGDQDRWTSYSHSITNGQLIDGDKVVTYRLPGEEIGVYPITAKIFRGEDDVTCEYEHYIIKGKFEIKKRSISLSVKDKQTMVYTGENLYIAPAVLLNVANNKEVPISYSYKKNDQITDYAREAGQYTITITAGDEYHNDVSKNITCNVSRALPVIIMEDQIVQYTGNPVIIDMPQISGGTARTDLTFKTEYEGIDGTSYDKSEVSPTLAGKYRIIISTEGDNNHEPAEIKAILTIEDNPTTIESTHDSGDLEVKVYPNPVEKGTSAYVEIKSHNDMLKNSLIHVYSVSGVYVSTTEVTDKITIVKLPSVAGTYILKVKGDKGLDKDVSVIVK